MYLGLDLRGGVHFLLQVDMKARARQGAPTATRPTSARCCARRRSSYVGRRARRRRRRACASATTPSARKARDEIDKRVPRPRRARAATPPAANRASSRRSSPRRRSAIQDGAVQQNITTLRNRVNELGVAEPIIQQQGADRVVVQLPGVQDTARAKDILGRTATLEIRMVNDDPGALGVGASAARCRSATTCSPSATAQPILVRRQVVLTGDRINDAQPGFDQRNNEPAVHVNLDGTGARIFKEVTRENVGKRMAIVLVEKGKAEVITAPVIREEIGGGRVQISGRMNTREANDIALLMRAGALAAPMEIVEERTVGPSLGKENIEKGFHSVLYGFIVLAVFICVYYALFGVISTIALVGQPAAAGRAPVDAAGDAHAARHRGHRADARHGDRRQRADQRAHPRGAALGRDAAGGDPGRLRARVGHDPRLERHDADRRPRAARVRHRARCAASPSSTASAS